MLIKFFRNVNQKVVRNAVSLLVKDQVSKNNIAVAEHILISAHELVLLYKDDLNQISKDNGLALFWTEEL